MATSLLTKPAAKGGSFLLESPRARGYFHSRRILRMTRN